MAVIKMNIQSQTLRKPTNITVILPTFSFSDYFEGNPVTYVKGMKYQVIYLLHGGCGDNNDYINYTNIVRYAYRNKIAVVIPDADNSCYTDFEDGTDYYQYVSEELPSFCQALFPISDQREDTFIGGISMGAHGAMKIAMNNPERYGAVLLLSGASYRPGVPSMVKTINGRFYFDQVVKAPFKPGINEKLHDPEFIKGTVNDVYAVAKKNAQEGKKLPKIFFRVGDCDHALYRAQQAEKDLKNWGYETRFEVVRGMGHEWNLWDESLRIALDEWLPIRHEIIYPEKKN